MANILWWKSDGNHVRVVVSRNGFPAKVLYDEVIQPEEMLTEDEQLLRYVDVLLPASSITWPDGNKAGGRWEVSIDPAGENSYEADVELHFFPECSLGYSYNDYNICCTESTPSEFCSSLPWTY